MHLLQSFPELHAPLSTVASTERLLPRYDIAHCDVAPHSSETLLLPCCGHMSHSHSSLPSAAFHVTCASTTSTRPATSGWKAARDPSGGGDSKLHRTRTSIGNSTALSLEALRPRTAVEDVRSPVRGSVRSGSDAYLMQSASTANVRGHVRRLTEVRGPIEVHYYSSVVATLLVSVTLTRML